MLCTIWTVNTCRFSIFPMLTHRKHLQPAVTQSNWMTIIMTRSYQSNRARHCTMGIIYIGPEQHWSKSVPCSLQCSSHRRYAQLPSTQQTTIENPTFKPFTTIQWVWKRTANYSTLKWCRAAVCCVNGNPYTQPTHTQHSTQTGRQNVYVIFMALAGISQKTIVNKTTTSELSVRIVVLVGPQADTQL